MTSHGRGERAPVLGAPAKCACAGLLAALGSLCGKLGGTLSAKSVLESIGGVTSIVHDPTRIQWIAWAVRILLYAALFACNAGMMSLQLQSMRTLPSLQATVINTSSNLASTAILGFLVLSEPVSARWLAGAACVMAGTLLILMSSKEQQQQKKKKPSPPAKEGENHACRSGDGSGSGSKKQGNSDGEGESSQWRNYPDDDDVGAPSKKDN